MVSSESAAVHREDFRMSRLLVTETGLVAHLNQGLLKHDTCTDCRFEHVAKLSAPDSEGCNWADPNLRCSGVTAVVCLPAAQHVVRSARAAFNIK